MLCKNPRAHFYKFHFSIFMKIFFLTKYFLASTKFFCVRKKYFCSTIDDVRKFFCQKNFLCERSENKKLCFENTIFEWGDKNFRSGIDFEKVSFWGVQKRRFCHFLKKHKNFLSKNGHFFWPSATRPGFFRKKRRFFENPQKQGSGKKIQKSGKKFKIFKKTGESSDHSKAFEGAFYFLRP